jgi:hypothetical protein
MTGLQMRPLHKSNAGNFPGALEILAVGVSVFAVLLSGSRLDFLIHILLAVAVRLNFINYSSYLYSRPIPYASIASFRGLSLYQALVTIGCDHRNLVAHPTIAARVHADHGTAPCHRVI